YTRTPGSARLARRPKSIAASLLIDDNPAMPNPIRHSLCRGCYEQIPLDTLCQHARSQGYEGIDLVTPGDFPTLKKHNLIGTMTPTHTIERGLAHKENWPECLAAIRKAIPPTADAGFPNIICFSGNRNGIDPHEGLRN